MLLRKKKSCTSCHKNIQIEANFYKDFHRIQLYAFTINTRDGNPAKKSSDSDSGFYYIFFALRIRIPI